MLGDAQEQGGNDRGRRNITHFFGYPEAPVQESKQLLPQPHKPLHLSVNVSDFVTLIVPYSAPGNKIKVICLENKQGYTFISLLHSPSFCSSCILFSDQMCSCSDIFYSICPPPSRDPTAAGQYPLSPRVPCGFTADDAKTCHKRRIKTPLHPRETEQLTDLPKEAQEKHAGALCGIFPMTKGSEPSSSSCSPSSPQTKVFLIAPALTLELCRCEHSGNSKFYTRLHICSCPAIPLQTLRSDTLLQIHSAAVTRGQSTALPGDVQSKLPQHEVQTGLRSCSISSSRLRITEQKKFAMICVH